MVAGLKADAARDAYLQFASQCLGELDSILSNPESWLDPKFIKQASGRLLKVREQISDVQDMVLIADLPPGVLYGQSKSARSQFRVVEHWLTGHFLFTGIIDAVLAIADELVRAMDATSAILRGDEICDNGVDDDSDGDIDEVDCIAI